MSDSIAVSLRNVSKVYRLYSSLTEQALDVFGISMLRFWRRPMFAQYQALNDVSLEIKRGDRVGILGRNGAGKTTLLKIISGNFSPSSGTVKVDGSIQALMRVGLGFHPEFTGYENIRSSLRYNALSESDLKTAVEDVVDFVELEEFLHQPMNTYSMGMQARLLFAVATAIKPDIMIVDEVLGAGDAYFSAKCAHRMEKLTFSGCTLLLVSHSMQQVLQFCDKAIWIESGKIVKEGASLSVVKAYEEFIQKLGKESSQRSGPNGSTLKNKELRESILRRVLKTESGRTEPVDETSASSGGVSRWGGGESGLTINHIRLRDDEENESRVILTGQALKIEIEVLAEQDGEYPCYFVILLFTEDGRCLSRHCSEAYLLKMRQGEQYSMRLYYPQTFLGNGTYSFSAAIYKTLDLNHLNESKFYDLLSRSFEFKVVGAYRDDLSVFHHPAIWVPQDRDAST